MARLRTMVIIVATVTCGVTGIARAGGNVHAGEAPTAVTSNVEHATSGHLHVSPERFAVQRVRPGDKLTLQLRVTNGTSRAVSVMPVAVSLRGSTNPRRLADVHPGDRSVRDVATWVSFPGFDERRSIAPGTALDVPVHIDVPTGSESGTYAVALGTTTSILAQGVSTGDAANVRAGIGVGSIAVVSVGSGGAAHLAMRTRRATRMLLLVRDARWSSRVTASGRSAASFTPHLRLHGIVGSDRTVTAASQTRNASNAIDILPGGVRVVDNNWPSPPLFGVYRPELELRDSSSHRVIARHHYPVLVVLPPWWLLTLIVLAVAVPLGTARRDRRRRRDAARRRNAARRQP